MSFESENSQGSNSGLDIIKPPAQTVGISFIDKYRTDLQHLKNGKMTIEAIMADKGIDDSEANKKLDKLSKSIKRLERLIEDYEKEHSYN